MKKNLRHLLCLVLLGCTLTACGFQLRGQYRFDFDSIDLSGMNNSEFYRTVKLQLQTNQLKVNPPEGAAIKLNLLSEQRERSIVTFSASGRAREVRLNYTVQFSVTDKQADYLIATSELNQRRELTYSDDQILGKEAEENRLYREMQEDMARQIIGRLSSLSLGKK